ncbi:TnsA-like heteromeric transposase endonuclease subunit [Microcella sp.]|uniref:TnsA-like heteromeric transposase endonuclease subunit n=1 Tax=Microcella sp. TaxID=1913979 RepID=UPI003F721A60
MNENVNPNPTAVVALRAQKFSGRASVSWLDATGQLQRANADSALLDRELYLAEPMRRGNHYPRQRNYHGWYYFSQTSSHVWCESKFEASQLAALDQGTGVLAISSQPMKVQFDDGTEHYPDFLALHDSHRQVLYDVKPTKYLTEKYLDQFARTKAMCDRVGWGYRVLTDFDPIDEINLQWIRQFKHPGFHPDRAAVRRLLPCLPGSLAIAAAALQPGNMPHGRAGIFHLLWLRTLHTAPGIRLSDSSVIEVSHDA